MSDTTVTLQVDAGPSPLRLRVHGEQDRFVSQRLRQDGIWEPFETTLLLSALAPGDVFVDVGANIGYFSLLAAAMVGEQGRVFAFEPDPANAQLLRESAVLNGLAGRIDLVEAALAEQDGQGDLYLASDNLGDHQVYAGGEARDTLPIRLLNGSDYLAPRLDRIAMIKIDTQGSEYQVVAGLMPLLRSLPGAPHLLIELTPYSLVEAGASGRALVELLGTLSQPLWIVDHIEHRLVESSVEELATWCDNVQATPGDRGFMNILAGPALD